MYAENENQSTHILVVDHGASTLFVNGKETPADDREITVTNVDDVFGLPHYEGAAKFSSGWLIDGQYNFRFTFED